MMRGIMVRRIRAINVDMLPRCGNCVLFGATACPMESVDGFGLLHGPHPEAPPCDRYKSRSTPPKDESSADADESSFHEQLP